MKATDAIDYYEDFYGSGSSNVRVKNQKKAVGEESVKSDNRKTNKIDKKNATKAPWKHYD